MGRVHHRSNHHLRRIRKFLERKQKVERKGKSFLLKYGRFSSSGASLHGERHSHGHS